MPEIAIVGGGIVGLALALNLHARGRSCRIYEAVPDLRELGVGVTLLPHAVRELAGLGLLAELEAIGIENTDNAFYNRFGQLIFSEPRGRRAGYPYPELGMHRGKLHGVLARAVRERLGPDAIRLGHRCVGVVEMNGRVRIHFADRDGKAVEAVDADAVVACDGVNSAIRRQYYPDDAVCFTGINTWRGVTRTRPFLNGRTYVRVGSIRTGKMVIYPIVDDIDGTGDQLINWVAEIQREGSPLNDWNKAGRAEDFLPLFQDWTYDWLDVAGLIRNAETIFEYPMVDKEPLERWSFGRVTLAGDAAHPMYPRGSNGSAQGLIDARVLADQLTSGATVEQAFEAYQAERLPLTGRVVRTNRVTPPDLINIVVEDRVGDRPFDDIDAVISRDELQAIADRYKGVAGFDLAAFAR